jgi:hypothetical protein
VTLEMAGRLRMAGEIPGAGCCRPDGGGPAGVYYVRGTPELIVPVDANPVALSTGAGWTAWTPVTAGLAFDLVVTRVLVAVEAGSVYADGRVEVGTGPQGEEAAVAESAWLRSLQATQSPSGRALHPQRVAPYRIPAGARISVRAIERSGAAANLHVYLQGYPGGVPSVQTLGQLQQDYLSGDATSASLTIPETGGIAMNPMTAWTWSAWTQTVASAPADMLAYGFAAGLPGSLYYTAAGGLIELGAGPGGEEVPLGAAGYCHGTSPMLFGHAVLVQAGERLAVRLKQSAPFAFPGVVILADRLL